MHHCKESIIVIPILQKRNWAQRNGGTSPPSVFLNTNSHTDMGICVYFIDNSYLLQTDNRISSFHFKNYKHMGQVILINSYYTVFFPSGGRYQINGQAIMES